MKHFSPKAFVFENVRGILASKDGEDFELICSSFREVGYKLYWRVLNAADYGVPQLRERLFLVGVREDIAVPFRFPRPTHGPDSLTRTPHVLAGEALRDLTNENETVPPYGGKYGHLLADIPEGENYRYYTEEMGHPRPLFAWRSKFSGFLQKLSRHDLSKTIVAYQGRYDGPFHWHNRKCTVAELKRLQGFPDGYAIPQSYTEAVKQIGNSVCPPVAACVGRALLFQLEGIEDLTMPLLEADEKLTFDKRKGDRARVSRSKKRVGYNDIMQPSLLSETGHAPNRTQKFTKRHTARGFDVEWKYRERRLDITLGDDEGGKGRTELTLRFFGGVTDMIKSVTAVAHSKQTEESVIDLLWSEVHLAVKELTSYESLQPLYGHFTEPYPKFEIAFKTNLRTLTAFFQRLAIDPTTLNKVLPYSALGERVEDKESFLKSMRDYGFDVRTHNTNRTVPSRHFRVCYPFTLSKDLRTYILWTDKNDTKATDFNIKHLID